MSEKHSLLAELIKMARADKVVRQEEYQFIKHVALMMGISKDELDPLFEKYIEITPPELESDRIVQFHRLVLLANVDHHLDARELEAIRDIGIRMGLRPFAIEQVLNEMKASSNGALSPDRLIQIFQVYHN